MAGQIMRSGDFRSIVEPILNSAFDGVYDQRKDEYKAVFAEEDGVARSYQEDVMLYGLTAAPLLQDGEPVTYDAGGQLYVTRTPYNQYAIAFAITKVLQEDGEHIRLGTTMAKHMAQSMSETLETVTANILNRATNSSYTGGDGVALASASHPVVGGTQSNVLTSAAFSQTSLEQGLITIRQAKDARGKAIRLSPKQIIVAPANMLNAEVILNSVLRSGTSNNDLNPVKSMGLVDKTVVLSRLTSSTQWGIQTDANQGLRVLWRRKPNKALEGDFESGSIRYKTDMRFGASWHDWRCYYNNAGV